METNVPPGNYSITAAAKGRGSRLRDGNHINGLPRQLNNMAKGRGSRLRDGNHWFKGFQEAITEAKGRGSRLRDGNRQPGVGVGCGTLG